MKGNRESAGLYTIDPFHGSLPSPARARSECPDALVTIVGLGGTGAFLAEDLARLFSVHFGWRVRLTLVDHDVVEEHNEQRQAFSKRDRGRPKAQVVGERLVRQFPVEVALSLAPYDHRRDAPRDERGGARSRLSLLVGCVDNPLARCELARTLRSDGYSQPVWWLDLGNSAASGQVLLGNVTRAEDLRGAFDPETHTCRALPAPSVQAPELLEAPLAALPAPEEDCAAAQAAGDQEPFVNRAIAALGLAMVTRLCQRRLTWRAAYFDLDVGTLRYIHLDPHDTASLLGVRTEKLVQRRRAAA
ncbi:MAG: ThiF family adenylyltransferase [Chloroflexi bacterium]|nr:ThiF family adenylyltransferase [Chloroflexota bacterium]